MKKIFLAAAICGAVALWWNFIYQKVVTLDASAGTTIELGLPSNTENGPALKSVILKADSNRVSKRLKTGVYEVLIHGSSEQLPTYKTIRLTANLRVATPSLGYTPEALAGLLAKQVGDIHAVLDQNIYLNSDAIAYERLYNDGTWYAAKYIDSGHSPASTWLIVLHKSAGQWKLAAGPAPILYRGDYPGIPFNVIDDINNQ